MDLVDFLGFPSANMVTGHRGMGKTSFGFKVLEDAHKHGLKCFIVGMPKSKHHLLPKFITPIDNLDDIPDKSAVFLDEAYIYAYARDHPRRFNKFLSKLIGVVRQKKWILVFASHSTRKLEIGVVMDLDAWVLRKPNYMHIYFERREIKEITLMAYNWFVKLEQNGKNVKEYAIVISNNKPKVIKVELPSFWNDDLSNAFAGVSLSDTEEE